MDAHKVVGQITNGLQLHRTHGICCTGVCVYIKNGISYHIYGIQRDCKAIYGTGLKMDKKQIANSKQIEFNGIVQIDSNIRTKSH